MRTLRQLTAAVFAFALMFAAAAAQTNPATFDLSASNFSFTSWPAASATGTFPANMAFHRTAIQDPAIGDETNADYALAYNLTSGARINGLDGNGFAFLNTGTNGNIGAAVAALNATNRTNVQVTFTCQLLLVGQRSYGVRLQYRTSTSSAWTDVPGPVEFLTDGKAANEQQTFGPITLPVDVNNQAVVQLRWKYYYLLNGTSGTRPQVRVDDITVGSVSSLNTPVKFAITTISPSSPSTTSTFSATVQSLSAGNVPSNVTQNTDFALTVATGTGTLGGTLTGTIAAGSNTVVVSGITYNTAQANVSITATRTSGELLTPGTSALFTVGAGAVGQTFVGLQAAANAGKRLRTFTVEARRPDGTLDPSYQGNTSVAATGGGSLTGTLTKPLVNGVATFNDVAFAAAGTFSLTATTAGLTQGTSAAIAVSPPVAMTSISIPQFVKSTSNTTRIPSYALVRFDNLIPNSQYRYYTSICSTATEPGGGAGNNIHYQEETGLFYVSSTKSHISTTVPPDYSSFTTATGQTSKTLWVNIVTTGNARFNEGQNVYWRVIMTDAAGFPCDTLTSGTPSRNLEFGQFSGNATGIYDSASSMQPRNYAVFYDNIDGAGNPLTTALVQSVGVTTRTSPTTGPAPYFEQLEFVAGSWATLIPNTLAGGVRRIEERAPNGSLVRFWTDEDGVWAGVNTVNPFLGISPAINFKTPQITLVSAPANGATYCSSGNMTINWTSRGVQSAQIELFKGSEAPIVIASNINGTAQTYPWAITGVTDSSRRYQIRVVDLEHQMTFGASAQFSIFLPPVITREPVSVNTCVGDNIRLVVQARGTGLKYQWQKDGADIPGATDTTLFLNNSTTLTSGLYRCIVTGVAPCSQAVSRISTVFVTPPIQILKQPEFKPAATGSRVELTVEVMGTENHKYQWRRGTQNLQNSTRISGVHSPTLIIHSFQAGDVGSNYNCVISGNLPCGTAISQSGGFRASSVQFTLQPDTTLGCTGGSAVFRSAAVSNPIGSPLTYLWVRDGKTLGNGSKYQGATTNTLTVINITPADTGLYWVEVSGPGNAAVTSRRALLRVGSAAKITQQPQSAKFCPGDATTLRASASGVAAPTYQWYLNGRAVAGATADTLNIYAPVSSDTVYAYRCVARTACGADTSAAAEISVYDKPVITEQPAAKLDLKTGGGIYLFVRFSAKHQVKFQWFKGTVPVLGGESAELRIPNIAPSDSGRYRCAVIGMCDTVYSDYADVKISLPSAVTESENVGYVTVTAIPNPASTVITLGFGLAEAAEVRVQLLEMTGRVVADMPLGKLDAGAQKATLDVSALAAGVYVCRIQAGGLQQFARVSVVR